MYRLKTLNNNTVASFPGAVSLSAAKLKILQPELFSPARWLLHLLTHPLTQNPASRSYWKVRIPEQLAFGDSRAAVVVSTSPLIVAAYTDELDCVALLRFGEKILGEYELKDGSRLITVNTYSSLDFGVARDLELGPAHCGRYGNFSPFIADFLTDDHGRLRERKAEIDEAEWQRAEELGRRLLRSPKITPRDGRPTLCYRHPTHSPQPKKQVLILLLIILWLATTLARQCG